MFFFFLNLEGKSRRESSKRTISASSELVLFTNGIRAKHRMMCQRGRWPQRGGLCDPTLVGEENEAFLIRVRRGVSKPGGETYKRKPKEHDIC